VGRGRLLEFVRLITKKCDLARVEAWIPDRPRDKPAFANS